MDVSPLCAGSQLPHRSRDYKLFELRRLHAVLLRMSHVWSENTDEPHVDTGMMQTEPLADRLRRILLAHGVDVDLYMVAEKASDDRS